MTWKFGHEAGADQLPASLGQKLSAASLSVVLASDYTLSVTDTNDKNYGVVGVTTLRTAAQIGNATGAADFAAGNTSAQTLRVVVATNQATLPVSAASLPLPTGAATAAKQPALGTAGAASTDVITVQGIASMTALKVDGSAVTQPTSVSNLPTTVDTNTGATGASTLRFIGAGRALTTTTPLTYDYTGGTVSTGAYTQIVASTANAINRLYVFDSSGSAIIIATGIAASEVDRIYIPPGGQPSIYELNIPAGTRIAIKALDVAASAGRLIITGLT